MKELIGVIDRGKCSVCGKEVGKSESSLALAMLVGEFSPEIGEARARFTHVDKHIRCSPSRAQRIVHPKFPPVVDERPAFDWRLWAEDRRDLFKHLYTNAWVRLQYESGKISSHCRKCSG